ncbi:MAG TPA: Holliday junction branch migration protein RuvA [Alphaproteobacteria bacterium]|nr:Holliday junction branch migration protein RuvA [Alphaproteobacteria bacterium]
MIAKLRGRLDSAGEDWAVIDVSGVGYLLYCSARTLRSLPGIGELVELFVDTHVREDHIHLYGFGAARERDWFTLLQTVQGVGARVALGLLSVLGPEDLAQAIAARDRVPLTRANGIGPKVANRILAELKDKMSETPLEPSAQYVGSESTGDGNMSADAISVLVNLGYGRSEAFRAIGVASRVLADDGDLQSLIRAGLKELG